MDFVNINELAFSFSIMVLITVTKLIVMVLNGIIIALQVVNEFLCDGKPKPTTLWVMTLQSSFFMVVASLEYCKREFSFETLRHLK
jgi:hypothetical protein